MSKMVMMGLIIGKRLINTLSETRSHLNFYGVAEDNF